MPEVVLRLARPGEGAAIVGFINAHFDLRLPLLNRGDLYSYYYAGSAPNDPPRFAVAECGGEYLSAAGYIPANRAGDAAWVSVWVAARGHNGVGLELMEALPRLIGADLLACNNIRPETCKLYEFLGWKAGRLGHYYRLGVPGPAGWQLAGPGEAGALPVGGGLPLVRVADADALEKLGLPPSPHTPRKDLWYLRRRYFEAPFFRYDVRAALSDGRPLAYAVTRTVSAADTGCVPVVRLVDYIGPDEVLPHLGAAFDGILRANGAEYIDCYNTGIPAAIWAAAGFSERRPGDGVTIPNYLTPPLHANTEYYYFTSNPESFVMFKADGDQDRPNYG